MPPSVWNPIVPVGEIVECGTLAREEESCQARAVAQRIPVPLSSGERVVQFGLDVRLRICGVRGQVPHCSI